MDNGAKELNLPDPGRGRWWKIELVLGQTGKPIKVSLMESFTGALKKPATVLFYMRTIANASDIKATAQKVLDAVGDYPAFIGEFFPKGPGASGWSTVTINGKHTPHYFRSGESISVCGKAFDSGTRSEAGPSRSSIDCPACSKVRGEVA